jgi:WD40 repeat protein
MSRPPVSGQILKAIASVGVIALVPSVPLSAQEAKPRATLQGHTREVLSLAFSADGKILASGSADQSAKLWDVATGANTTTLKEAGAYGWCTVALSPDGKTLASGSGGNKIKLWELASGKSTTILNRQSQYRCPSVVYSPDGKTLVSGGRCVEHMKLWDVATGKEIATLNGHSLYGVKAMAFTPDSQILASVGHDGVFNLWDVATCKNTSQREIARWIPAAAFSPDGQTLAIATCRIESVADKNVVVEKTVKLFDAASGKQRVICEGHAGIVSCLAFTPDGRMLATGSDDKTIKLWEVATGKLRATFQGHTAEVHSVVFSPDGKMLASCSEDKTINLWDVVRAK